MDTQQLGPGEIHESWVSPQDLSDHERYPTVVSSSDGYVPINRDQAKIHVPEYVGLEVDGSRHSEVMRDNMGEKRVHDRICGIQKKTFWIVLLISLMICLAIGGGVGGSLATRNKPNAGTDPYTTTTVSGLTVATPEFTTTTSATTTTVATRATTSPIATTGLKIGSLAATYSLDENSKPNSRRLAIFYQDANTNDIVYRLLHSSASPAQFQPPQTLSLPIQPRVATSLAAWALPTNLSAVPQISLYYIDGSSSPKIIEVLLKCPNISSLIDSTCSILQSNEIKLTQPHPLSKLSVVFFPGGFGTRLFYQDDQLRVQQGVRFNDFGGSWSTTDILSQAESAIVGSPLSASVDEDHSVYLHYYDANDILSTANYTAPIKDAKWGKSVKLIEAAKTDSKIALASFTERQSPGDKAVNRVYHARNDSRIIENNTQIDLGKVSPTWSSLQNGYAVTRDEVVGGVAAVGWMDNVRVFFVKEGIMKVASHYPTSADDKTPVWATYGIDG